MSKETQPKKSVEQTFLEKFGLKYEIEGFTGFDFVILVEWTRYLEREGHIKLTGTYKP